jgi:hypothetical protein
MLKFFKSDSDRPDDAAPGPQRGPETEAALTDAFEQYRRPHAARIAEVAVELAAAFGFDESARLEIRQAALLHDIGERQLNLHFLKLERPLTFLERQELWRHPVVGEQFAVQNGYSTAVSLLIRWHHENWDGFGYPDGLRGEAIPLAARILRVADVWCALTADRPFRAAHSAVEAAEMLKKLAGFELDPQVTARLLAHPDVREMLRAETEPPPIAVEPPPPESAAEVVVFAEPVADEPVAELPTEIEPSAEAEPVAVETPVETPAEPVTEVQAPEVVVHPEPVETFEVTESAAHAAEPTEADPVVVPSPLAAEIAQRIEAAEKPVAPVVFAEPQFPDARDIHPPVGTVFDTVQELAPTALPVQEPPTAEFLGPLTPAEPAPAPEIVPEIAPEPVRPDDIHPHGGPSQWPD